MFLEIAQIVADPQSHIASKFTLVDYALIFAAGVATIGAIWAAIDHIFSPRVSLAIQNSINKMVSPQLAEVPKLTRAVERLTDSLERQGQDTRDLNFTIEKLELKIDGLSKDMGSLSERTATLEGIIPTIESLIESRVGRRRPRPTRNTKKK
jgi:hypothetical protein